MIDERDYKVLGSPSPDWTAGMTNTFTYKNWDLSFYMYARIGGTYNDDFTYMFTAWDNEHWNKLNVKYWTPENHSNEYQQIGAQSYHTQVLGKISGSFLKIQNITLGYTLPENWMKKMKMKMHVLTSMCRIRLLSPTISVRIPKRLVKTYTSLCHFIR